MTDPEASHGAFHRLVEDLLRRSEGVPDHELIGFFKAGVLYYPGVLDCDREAMFQIVQRLGKAATPTDRGDVRLTVKNIQNANSSATANPQISQAVTVSPGLGSPAQSRVAVPEGSAIDGQVKREPGDQESKEDRDGMTTLLRRDAFDAKSPSLLEAAKANGSPLGIIMMDVDKFKTVNDVHGHQKGDEVLRDVGRCVAMMVGDKGEAYRYGGEEIVVVLPGCDEQQAASLAERLRAVLQAQRAGDLDITASFGVASFPAHAASLSDLVLMADKALYAAKEGGRNQVHVHGAEERFES